MNTLILYLFFSLLHIEVCAWLLYGPFEAPIHRPRIFHWVTVKATDMRTRLDLYNNHTTPPPPQSGCVTNWTQAPAIGADWEILLLLLPFFLSHFLFLEWVTEFSQNQPERSKSIRCVWINSHIGCTVLVFLLCAEYKIRHTDRIQFGRLFRCTTATAQLHCCTTKWCI